MSQRKRSLFQSGSMQLLTVTRYLIESVRFALMGGLDVIATIMMMFGGAKTAGPLQTLMRQLPLLFTLAITALFFKVRYVPS